REIRANLAERSPGGNPVTGFALQPDAQRRKRRFDDDGLAIRLSDGANVHRAVLTFDLNRAGNPVENHGAEASDHLRAARILSSYAPVLVLYGKQAVDISGMNGCKAGFQIRRPM